MWHNWLCYATPDLLQIILTPEVILYKDIVIVPTMLQEMVKARHPSTTAVRSRNAVSAIFTSKQLLPFGFADQCNSGLAW